MTPDTQNQLACRLLIHAGHLELTCTTKQTSETVSVSVSGCRWEHSSCYDAWGYTLVFLNQAKYVYLHVGNAGHEAVVVRVILHLDATMHMQKGVVMVACISVM